MGKTGLIDKLKKLFGFIKVKELDFSFKNHSKRLPVSIKAKSKEKNFSINSISTSKESFSQFNTNIISESKENIIASVKEGSFDTKKIKISSENIFHESTKILSNENFKIKSPTAKKIEIENLKKIANLNKLKNFKILKSSETKTRETKLLTKKSLIFNGTPLVLKLRIKRRRNFFHYTKEEQLKIWKKIVAHTGKRPRELELIGLFSNFPTKIASNIKLNFKTGDIYFSIDKKNSKIIEEREMIIVIRDKENENAEIIKF